eukprot:scaffold42251_cov57-Phaeocystis_antarctica.AAC.2
MPATSPAAVRHQVERTMHANLRFSATHRFDADSKLAGRIELTYLRFYVGLGEYGNALFPPLTGPERHVC